SLSPDVVVSSTLYSWDPYVRYIIDQWWDHVVKGEPFNAPNDSIVFLMAEGGCDIAPYHGMKARVPEKVRKKVAAIRQKIIDGKFKVPQNPAKAVSSR
ncbi:MAG: BMP family ABC transporter substrate-binding protein, partial [Candidatus Auribacterota bacterium]|nr:BMP family ABC transporter substrate-binding protein [Candidatus Auribacterota bacterium]